jgi:SAM-dependent methyltransferase
MAQNMPSESELGNEKGLDYNVCQCTRCGLVQLDCNAVFYYKDVIRSGGFSSVMINLRKNQYADFVNKFNLNGKRILEVGCGGGEFLQILKEFDVQPFGIENNPELAEFARLKGLTVYNGFIGNKNDIISNEKFDAFLSFNFLEHQPDPNGMLQGIYNNTIENATGLITVPSFEYFIEQNSFYEFIRDHIAYYTENTLSFLLCKNGFDVLEVYRFNRDTIAMHVKKLQRLDLSPLKENFNRLNNSIQHYLSEIKKSGGVVAVWGASHQGFTILSASNIGKSVDYIIDSAIFKQGKFSPVTHVPIVSPDYYFNRKADAIIIIAPGYSNEIYQIINNKYGTDVRVATIKSDTLEILR